MDNSVGETDPRTMPKGSEEASEAISDYFRDTLLNPSNVTYSVDKRWIKSDLAVDNFCESLNLKINVDNLSTGFVDKSGQLSTEEIIGE